MKTMSGKVGWLILLLVLAGQVYGRTVTRLPDDYAPDSQGSAGWHYCWSFQGKREKLQVVSELEWINASTGEYPLPGHEGQGYYKEAAFIREASGAAIIISPYAKSQIWPFLRWVSPDDAAGYSIVGSFRRTQVDAEGIGDGVSAAIYVNGKEVFTKEISNNDQEFHDFSVQMKEPLAKGDVVELVVCPKGNDFFDNVEVVVEISAAAG